MTLLYLFNISLSTGTFPDAWKVNIHHVPKSLSELSNISNYQPISLPSIIPEIFESIVTSKVMPVLVNIIVSDVIKVQLLTCLSYKILYLMPFRLELELTSFILIFLRDLIKSITRFYFQN